MRPVLQLRCLPAQSIQAGRPVRAMGVSSSPSPAPSRQPPLTLNKVSYPCLGEDAFRGRRMLLRSRHPPPRCCSPVSLLRLTVPPPACQTREKNRNRSLKFTTRHSGFQKYKQKWQSSRGKIHFFRADLSLEHVLLICSQGKASMVV